MGNFIMYLFCSALTMVLCFSNMTSDHDIKKGKKIKIENAVYECKKTQELDLK